MRSEACWHNRLRISRFAELGHAERSRAEGATAQTGGDLFDDTLQHRVVRGFVTSVAQACAASAPAH